jgi:hypothetical protein
MYNAYSLVLIFMVKPLSFQSYLTHSPKPTFLHKSPPVYTHNYVLAPGLFFWKPP